MKKIPSLFKRDYDGDRLVYDEVVEGCEWVLAGEGVATEKYDGTACMVQDGVLYKRYDRKPSKSAKRRHKEGELWQESELKPAPDGWIPAQDEPDLVTGHWPGWLRVGDGPEDKWHREAFSTHVQLAGWRDLQKTYELIGPKVQGNPYNLESHVLQFHGPVLTNAPRTFEEIRDYLEQTDIEGIVWHHPDGRMAKIKRRDFGLDWPVRDSD